jgi:hypothetical protein
MMYSAFNQWCYFGLYVQIVHITLIFLGMIGSFNLNILSNCGAKKLAGKISQLLLSCESSTIV